MSQKRVASVAPVAPVAPVAWALQSSLLRLAANMTARTSPWFVVMSVSVNDRKRAWMATKRDGVACGVPTTDHMRDMRAWAARALV